jgi:hypothetical protein
MWLYELDAAGCEVEFRRQEGAGRVSDELVKLVAESAYDDVILIVHGWDTQQEGGKGTKHTPGISDSCWLADSRFADGTVV